MTLALGLLPWVALECSALARLRRKRQVLCVLPIAPFDRPRHDAPEALADLRPNGRACHGRCSFMRFMS
jgi:hypothetical protein